MTKRLMISMILGGLLLGANVFAGIDFESMTYEDALKKAKGENKLVMVDFYTDWCKWCKKLDKDVFSDEAVGIFVNEHFVAIKVDAEKGNGPALKESFRVPGYPTVVFVDASGAEIDRAVGYAERDDYFQIIKDYVAGKNTLNDYLSQLSSHETDIELHYKVARKYDDRGQADKAMDHFEEILALDPDNKAGYHDEARFQIGYYRYELNQNLAPLEEYAAVGTDDNHVKRAYGLIARAHAKADKMDLAIATYEASIKRFPESANMRNAYAWFVFKKRIKETYPRAIEVAQEALKLEPEADAIWDTLGQLYFANGQVQEAAAAMKEALKLNPEEASYQTNLNEYEAAMGNVQGN